MVAVKEEGWQGCRKKRHYWKHEYDTYLSTVSFHCYRDTCIPDAQLNLDLRAKVCRAAYGYGLVSVQTSVATLLSMHMIILKKLETRKAPTINPLGL